MTPLLELLSPARTAEIGREAILHGADAVYIGGPSFGARANASNSVKDIAGLCDFAHRYHARVFATLNTILHDSELEPAGKLVWELYDAGVDALIVQDMGLLELDLPPIELHASTQTDIRSIGKAKFLSEAGFSQIVLARELTLSEIGAIGATLATPFWSFSSTVRSASRIPGNATSAMPIPAEAPTGATAPRHAVFPIPCRTGRGGWWPMRSICSR